MRPTVEPTVIELNASPLSLTKSGRFSVIDAPLGTAVISSETVQEAIDQNDYFLL